VEVTALALIGKGIAIAYTQGHKLLAARGFYLVGGW
jgi:hypothetical protein